MRIKSNLQGLVPYPGAVGSGSGQHLTRMAVALRNIVTMLMLLHATVQRLDTVDHGEFHSQLLIILNYWCKGPQRDGSPLVHDMSFWNSGTSLSRLDSGLARLWLMPDWLVVLLAPGLHVFLAFSNDREASLPKSQRLLRKTRNISCVGNSFFCAQTKSLFFGWTISNWAFVPKVAK